MSCDKLNSQRLRNGQQKAAVEYKGNVRRGPPFRCLLTTAQVDSLCECTVLLFDSAISVKNIPSKVDRLIPKYLCQSPTAYRNH